jgi:hypothetical protein
VDEGSVIEVELPNGQLMLAQVQPIGRAGPQDIGLEQLVSLDAITHTLQGVAVTVLGALEQVKPSRATVEFGLALTVKGGKLMSLLVASEGDASLKVTLEWQGRTQSA